MIYIDPPYNTGKTLLYDDDFNKERKSKAHSHSNWLNMMYPRLLLAKDLLSCDGLIFISIDDNEQAELKLLCDEVFGANNFINKLVIELGMPIGGKSMYKNTNFLKMKEYIYIYAKDKKYKKLKAPLYDYSGDFFDIHYKYYMKDNCLMKLSNYFKSDEKFSSFFKKYNLKITMKNIQTLILIDKEFKKLLYSISNNIYKDSAYTKKVQMDLEVDKIYFHKGVYLFQTRTKKLRYLQPLKLENHNFKRRFLRGDLWKDFHKDLANISKEGNVTFKNGKKPVRLISDLISWCNLEDNDFILDFFAGSGTTAHSTICLNAQDKVKRNFILIQEETKNNDISKICLKRLHNVSRQYDFGFKVYSL